MNDPILDHSLERLLPIIVVLFVIALLPMAAGLIWVLLQS